MEKKTTQRIIGIVVAMALVIILLPLLFGKNEAATETASIKAPPFPDQPVDANPSAAPVKVAENEAPSDLVITPELADKINHVASTEKTVVTSEQSTTSVEPKAPEASQPTPELEPQKFSVIANTPEQDAKAIAAVPAPTTQTSDVIPIPTPTAHSAVAPRVKPAVDDTAVVTPSKPKKITSHAKTTHGVKMASASHIKPKNLISLKKVAWAVQLGSFKNKDNARRLADKLRASGYKAFTHEIKSAKGNTQTRVYIGPEFKQASAAKLSMKLEQNLNMHGYVVPYKPLEI